MLLDILLSRFKQGHQTMKYPDGPPPVMPPHFAGIPVIDQTLCQSCPAPCINQCPTHALKKQGDQLQLDMGRCLFCRDCENSCPNQAIHFTEEYQLGSTNRKSLIVNQNTPAVPSAQNDQAAKLCGKSFALRVVSAGGCGACEADTNVLNTLAWDLSRFGIHYVASPRHADGLLLIGPITKNMAAAVKAAYDAIPTPKFVIAVGTCAVSGGIYADSDECVDDRDNFIPIDLYIPGCPPHPLTILDGLLRFLGKTSAQATPSVENR